MVLYILCNAPYAVNAIWDSAVEIKKQRTLSKLLWRNSTFLPLQIFSNKCSGSWKCNRASTAQHFLHKSWVWDVNQILKMKYCQTADVPLSFLLTYSHVIRADTQLFFQQSWLDFESCYEYPHTGDFNTSV